MRSIGKKILPQNAIEPAFEREEKEGAQKLVTKLGPGGKKKRFKIAPGGEAGERRRKTADRREGRTAGGKKGSFKQKHRYRSNNSHEGKGVCPAIK